MHQPHAAARQHRPRHLVIIGGHGLHIALVLVDHRAYQIRLPSRLDLAADKAIQIGAFFACNGIRFYRRAPRRQLVQYRDIQIAKQQEPQRARNGGCAHHQKMRMIGLGRKLPALAHAKAVLLVCNGEAKPRKAHALAQHRMRTHHQLRLACLDSAQHLFFCLALYAARKQRRTDAQRRQQPAKRFGVLRGQNLGGRHQYALVSVLRGGVYARGGHQCFAAAHISLQKAVHRRFFHKIGHDLPGAAALRVCGRKRQRRPKRL